jgi:hypothetical protein
MIKLPLERLKRNVIRKENPTMIRTKSATPLEVHDLQRNKGKCQPAHRIPSNKEACHGPARFCNLGSANPLHPGSSPSGPPMSVDGSKNEKEKRADQCSDETGALASPIAGRAAKVKPTRSGQISRVRIHRNGLEMGLFRGHRWLVTLKVTKADMVGPSVPSTVITGRERLRGIQPRPARDNPRGRKNSHAMPYARQKKNRSCLRSIARFTLCPRRSQDIQHLARSKQVEVEINH